MPTPNQKDFLSLLKVLKSLLRSRKLNYADVARGIDVSEVTIKRVLAGKNPSLSHVMAICDFLQISFLHLAQMAKDLEIPETVLNKEQDLYFAKNPSHYSIFIELYRRLPVEDVKIKWKLSENAYFRFLMDMERLGLIKVGSHGHFQFLVSGPLRIPKQGKLREVFFRQNVEFLNYVQNSNTLIETHITTSEVLVTAQTRDRFLKDMENLIKKFRQQSHTDEIFTSGNERLSFRFLFAASDYQSTFRDGKS